MLKNSLESLNNQYKIIANEYLELEPKRKEIDIQIKTNLNEKNRLIKAIQKAELQLSYERAKSGVSLSKDPSVPSVLFTIDESGNIPQLIVYVLSYENKDQYIYRSICGNSEVSLNRNNLAIHKDIGFFRSKKELFRYKYSAIEFSPFK